MYSKKTNYQSGRPDLNGRPLDPQSHSGHRWASPSRAHWALEQVKRWPDVAECGLKKPVSVGSQNGSPRWGTAKPGSGQIPGVASLLAHLGSSPGGDGGGPL